MQGFQDSEDTANLPQTLEAARGRGPPMLPRDAPARSAAALGFPSSGARRTTRPPAAPDPPVSGRENACLPGLNGETARPGHWLSVLPNGTARDLKTVVGCTCVHPQRTN